MLNLAGLASFAGGAQQGATNYQQFQQRAQQVQQGQMALDTAKKQLAADAAAFSGLDAGGAGGGGFGGMTLPGAMSPPPPSAQPMPPGQPSMPAQPPQGGPAMPGQPPGAMPAPQQQQPPQGAPQQPMQQQGGGQGGVDPTDPRAAVQTVMSIAKEIKSRNPGIDPQTLMLATDRVISMSKGIAPAIRQGAQVVIQQMRDATSQANTQARVGATERGQDMQQENVGTRTASNERIAGGHDATSMARVQAQASAAMERTQATIAGANQRASQGVWSREKAMAYKEKAGGAIAKLKAANSRLTALTNAGVGPADPRVAAATKDITGATAELDRINSAAKVEPAPGGNGAGPQPEPVPPVHANDPDGSEYAKGDTTYVKQGNMMVPKASK